MTATQTATPDEDDLVLVGYMNEGTGAITRYTRTPHAAHYEGGGGHDLEIWDAVREWNDPRPACVPADAERHHGYLDDQKQQHVVFTRTAPLSGSCPRCEARA